MVKAGLELLRDSGRILLEAAPAGLNPDTIADRLLTQPNVVEIHDLHVWTITSNQPALSAHVLVTPGVDCHAVRIDLQALLDREYAVTHATLPVDHTGDDLLQIAGGPDDAEHCAEPHGPVHRGDSHEH
jgi:cobalt-zinc-cadmium efflux system protein